jgi:hypothetical protein
MPRIALDSTPFYGSTSRPAAWIEYACNVCLGCGSSLHGRSEGYGTWGDKVVQLYRYRCGRGRRLEVAARWTPERDSRGVDLLALCV